MVAMRPRLHILLVLALLVLSWLQLSHQTDLHVHDDNGSCELCLFAGNLQHGATMVASMPAPSQVHFYFNLRRYASPTLTQPCLLLPRLRGPPPLSFA